MSTSPAGLRVVPVTGPGAEDVLVGTHGPDEGAVFTGTADGAIVRVGHDGRRVDRVGHTRGRPHRAARAPRHRRDGDGRPRRAGLAVADLAR